MLRDEAVLDEDVVPEHELVVHRQDELERLDNSMRQRTSGDLTYLLGPTGTGKTMCTRLRVGNTGGSAPPLAYVNCWSHYERTDILYQCVDELCAGVVHRTSTPQGLLLDRLQQDPEEKRYVILDEADQLHDKAVIYDLLECPDLHLILIANNEDDLFGGIDDRLQSRLAVGTRITFDAYSAAELSAILAKRAEHAFQTPAISDRQLDTIAEHAGGDARVAIRSLREATFHARDEGRREITDADIEAAIPQARRQLRQKSLAQLNDHQQVVYEVVVESGPIAPSDIHEEYCERVDDPRTQRTIRSYLRKLVHYNLLDAQGTSRDREYTDI